MMKSWPEFWKGLVSEGGKTSSKRVLAIAFSLVAIYLLIFENNQDKLNSLLIFIGSLVGLSVANKFKAFNQDNNKKDDEEHK